MTSPESQSFHFSNLYKFLPKQLKSRRLTGLVLAVGIAGGGLLIYRAVATQDTNSQLVTTTVQQKSMPITISANGEVEADLSINLSPKTSGYLKQLLVKEGDRVEEGAIIAYMDDSDFQGELTQARAQLAEQEANLNKLLNGNRSEDIAQGQAELDEAKANLQKLEAGNRSEDIAEAQAQLSQAQADLNLAEDELQRNQSLFDEGAISEQTLVQKQATKDAAQAAVGEAQAALELQQNGSRSEDIAEGRALVEQRQQAFNLLKAGSRDEDIEIARAQVESARGALQTIETEVNDTIITAPFAGVVTQKYADTGSFVTPTTAGSSVEGAASNSIVTLVSIYEVVAYVDEANIERVKVDQPVQIVADSYPDRTFNGSVSQIAVQATTTSNVTSFEVEIALDSEAQELLKVGMNVETEFQIGQLDNAILVPSAAVVRNSDGTGVYVVEEDDSFVFKEIEIGTTVDEQTEVKSGLSQSDRVLISFPPGMEPESETRSPLGDFSGDKNSNSSSSNEASSPSEL
jgi:HlyD family secretion protein